MNRDILMQALQACRQEQAPNRLKEQQNEKAAVKVCPQIGKLMSARRQAIMDNLRLALNGIAPDKLEEATNKRNKEIKRLLKENGFPENHLEPIYTCCDCRDTGFTGEHKKEFCSCVLKRYQNMVCEAIAMPTTGETFENFDERVFSPNVMEGLGISQREYAQVLRHRCEQYADALPCGKTRNLLFYGRSGLGKTFLLRAIAKRAKDRGVASLSVSANTLLNQIRKAYFSHEDEAMSLIYRTDLLLEDDLGTEPMWENITIEQLFALIDARLNDNKNTVISTNLTLTELQSRYTERIASRLMDPRTGLSLHFLGDDIRKRPQ